MEPIWAWIEPYPQLGFFIPFITQMAHNLKVINQVMLK